MNGASYVRVEIDSNTVVYMKPGSNYCIFGNESEEDGTEIYTSIMIEGLGSPIEILDVTPQRIRELFEEAKSHRII